eukprot:scaffold9028_cov298-Chaetoceros_neogracile.AAC.2
MAQIVSTSNDDFATLNDKGDSVGGDRGAKAAVLDGTATSTKRGGVTAMEKRTGAGAGAGAGAGVLFIGRQRKIKVIPTMSGFAFTTTDEDTTRKNCILDSSTSRGAGRRIRAENGGSGRREGAMKAQWTVTGNGGKRVIGMKRMVVGRWDRNSMFTMLVTAGVFFFLSQSVSLAEAMEISSNVEDDTSTLKLHHISDEIPIVPDVTGIESISEDVLKKGDFLLLERKEAGTASAGTVAYEKVTLIGTCDCTNGVKESHLSRLAKFNSSGYVIGIARVSDCLNTTCADSNQKGLGDSMTYTIEGTVVLVDEDSSPKISTVQVLSAIQKYAASLVKGVAGEAKIVRDINMNAKFYMRPCGSLTKQSKKKLWSFDHKGQIRSTNNPQWCMAWAGGKKKKLWLEKCDTRRKTASFEYVKSQKAIVVTNTKNDKRFLIGFNTVKKYGKLRLYGVNSKNRSVSSFLMMVVPTHVLSDAPSALPSGEPTLPPSPMPSDLPSKQPTPSPTAKPTSNPTAKPSRKPTPSPTFSCAVKTFSELQDAIGVGGAIKLCSTPIIFTKQIDLSGKTLTFTCPNGDCVLDAKLQSRFFVIQGDSDISFDGITFKNGSESEGGAILIVNAGGSVVSITGSKFEGNTATGELYANSGGAIYSNDGGSVFITGSKFIENTAGAGGAIFNEGGWWSGGSVDITGSKFEGNTAVNAGGAIYNYHGGTMVITGSEFEGNTAAGDGNNIREYGGDTTCHDGTNTFESSGGGGIDDSDGNYWPGLCAPPTFCNCGDFQQAGLCTCSHSPSWMADPAKAVTVPGACAREKCCFCQSNFLQPNICQRDKCEGPIENENILNYPGCTANLWLGLIGNGVCQGGDYNTALCEFDGGDCDDFNAKYPGCNVDDPRNIGNGYCNLYDYNTAECESDGGDCDDFNLAYPHCNVDYSHWIGDGRCNGGDYNTAECESDGGDCDAFNLAYPDCNVDRPDLIGNGRCHTGDYNTAECGSDGGDCDVPNYPDCYVGSPSYIGNGVCSNYPPYNTAECGFDGGDCL